MFNPWSEFEKLWDKGKIVNPENGKTYAYCCKHYDEGSIFGLEGGAISKLEIRLDGKTVCHYEGRWEVKPVGDVKAVYELLLAKYN